MDEDERIGRAIERSEVVSAILVRLDRGSSHGGAITQVQEERRRLGKPTPSRSTLYRWLEKYHKSMWAGLLRKKRQIAKAALSSEFKSFVVETKRQDPAISLPEVILLAREKGVIGHHQKISLSTLNRFAHEHNLPFGVRGQKQSSARAYAYSMPMHMVLLDGVHFRAGPTKRKRVAVILIDDATRSILSIATGPSENTRVFAKAVLQMVRDYGSPRMLYMDHGSAFTAKYSKAICHRLGINPIFGSVRYPEARGKIERFNRTIRAKCLRGLTKDGINPDPESLDIRLQSFARDVYNATIHSVTGRKPVEHFEELTDSFEPRSEDDLARHFCFEQTRRVSGQSLISHGNISYEAPAGYAGRRATIRFNLISDKVEFFHHGKWIELHPPDLQANAYDQRQAPKPKATHRDRITTAAEVHFERKYGSITAPDGGFTETEGGQND